MSSTETGKIGENIASDHLLQNGYRIAERNYRAGRCEIDIIAWAPDGQLVFIEVKTRAGEGFGGPEASITRKKQEKLLRAAGAYMVATNYGWAIRFDTIAVVLYKNRPAVVRHHKDAFFL